MEKLQVILELVAQQFKREAKAAASATGEIGKAASEATGPLGKASNKFKEFWANGGKMKAALAAVAVGKFAQEAIKSASDLAESVNAVQKTFGEASGQVLAFSKVASQAAGLSASEFNSLATSTGSLLSNFGFSAEKAAFETTRLTLRASDLASVFNTSVPDALNAVNAALRGETEPIRRYGVSLSDAAIRAKAVEMGLAETTAAVDANGKAVAALELIYEQSAKAQGDFLQTSDSVANSQRRIAAEWENTKAALGESALPVVSAGLDRFAEGLLIVRSWFDDSAKSSQVFNEAIGYLNDKMRDGGDATSAFANALGHVVTAGTLTADQLLAIAAAAQISYDDLAPLGDQIIEMARAAGWAEEDVAELEAAFKGIGGEAGPAGDAVEGAGGQMGDAADEAGGLAEQLKKARDAQKALADEMLKSTDPIFKAISGIEGVRKAEDDLADVRKDRKSKAEDIAKAELDYARALLEAQAAMEGLGDGNLIRAIDSIAIALGKPRTEVEKLLEQLGLLDGKTVTTFVETRMYTTTPGGRTVGGDRVVGTNVSGRRAQGGPVEANRAYLVGERGPELFIPTMAGKVLANGTGGSSITINFNNPRLADDPLEGVRTALAFDGLEARA